MENAILIILGKTAKPISIRGAEIVALRDEDQESWNGTIKESWNGAIIDEIHVNFNFDKQTITMLPLGQQMYRSEDNKQMIMCGDIENPITVRGPDRANDDVTPDFFCEMAFHYYHPAALRKVSRNHGEATGEWDIA